MLETLKNIKNIVARRVITLIMHYYAISTNFGLFELTLMSFFLRNAVQTC